MLHAKEVSKEKPKVVSVQTRERLMVEPNKWRFVVGWVVEEREALGMPRSSTGWATNWWEDSSEEVSTSNKNGW